MTAQLAFLQKCPRCARRIQHDAAELAALAARLDRCLAGTSVTGRLKLDAHELNVALACVAGTCSREPVL